MEEGPFTVDLRALPPTVSEVLVLAVLAAFERRAAKTGGDQGRGGITGEMGGYGAGCAAVSGSELRQV